MKYIDAKYILYFLHVALATKRSAVGQQTET